MTDPRSRRRNRPRLWHRISIVAVLAMLIVAYRLVETIGPEHRPDDRFVVVRVVDGDTMELMGGDQMVVTESEQLNRITKIHEHILHSIRESPSSILL